MSVISSCLTHAAKMETQGGTRVTLLDTNGNARPSADARNGEIFIFFRVLAFTHLFALHTCELGQRKCKRKVKTAWTCESPLRFLKLLYLQWSEVFGLHASCTFAGVLFESLVWRERTRSDLQHSLRVWGN